MALVVALTAMVPALATVPSSVNAVPLVTLRIEPATVEPPLSTLLVLPLTVSITALLPTVCNLPPETVTPSRSTWAPTPDARIKPALALVTVIPSSSTLAFVPAAAIVFALATSLSMTSPALVAPCSVPELITRWAPVLMVSVELALPSMLPLLISVRLASPIVPAPEMVLPALVSVAALP